MANYQRLEASLAAALVKSIGDGPPVVTKVVALLDAIPYYKDDQVGVVHRAALTNLLAIYLPYATPMPQPPEQKKWRAHFYIGDPKAYGEAFFPQLDITPVASSSAVAVQQADPRRNGVWWGRYGVVVLTDAIRKKIPVNLDTARLDEDLSAYARALDPVLAASYMAVLTDGYEPTAAALRGIEPVSRPEAVALLEQAIEAGQFTANVNELLAMGGEDAIAASWFLFNLWIILKMLGLVDVDAAILRFKNSGLNVPPQLDPGAWWLGGYVSWFVPLDGYALLPMASAGIGLDMPQWYVYFDPGLHMVFQRSDPARNGYAVSLCLWGELSWYKP
ncbi:MAG TPA: hypothetical protein VL547_00610 [Dinghuibacter sp.]|uniref:hypothetical protein n=1 Tax=Dinghuibacter sp. TaxID=2024697 RepID=UPI002B9E8F42|nr:hypothetical protein [Dinghuibacter sp.]HTJ10489.1 hypothetical protein [Dinghuibacter sp.]